MKRILPVFFAFLVLLALPVRAEGGKLSATAAASGDKVTLTVRLDNPGIIATRIFVHYDTTVLQLTGAENGVIFPSGTFGNDLSANPYTLLWDESLRRDNNTTSGTLCTLTFSVRGGTDSGKTTVRVEVDSESTFDVAMESVIITDCAYSIDIPANEPEPAADRVRSVTADDPALHYKRSGWIRPVVTSDNGATYSVNSGSPFTVTYSDFDHNIISVDADGRVTAGNCGSTTVRITAADKYGNTAECTCTVTVSYAWWQILIRLFLLGFLWY